MSAIGAWLEGLGLARYADVFEENDIDMDVLPDLGEAQLERLGVSLGHGMKILAAAKRLAEAPVPAHEDGPERAVCAWLDIVGAVKALDVPAALLARIGIATGPVVVDGVALSAAKAWKESRR